MLTLIHSQKLTFIEGRVQDIYIIVLADFQKLSTLYIHVFKILCPVQNGIISDGLFTFAYFYKC